MSPKALRKCPACHKTIRRGQAVALYIAEGKHDAKGGPVFVTAHAACQQAMERKRFLVVIPEEGAGSA